MAGFRPVSTDQSLPEMEESVLRRWREGRVFERSLEERASSPLWSFYEGPPTANGRPGSHHVLSRVFKDVYPRFQSMRGHFVPRKAGWDCHGLPVELEVERELGISSKEEIEDYGIAEFNAKCRESVFRYVEEWNALTERIGFWIDLDEPYVTMDDDYIESVWWALREMWNCDSLYEGHKVVPYCPRCGTALSSHEVALGYREVEDPSIYVRFPVAEGDAGPLREGDSLLIWTTTPWTLVSNAAVAVGADVEYGRFPDPDDSSHSLVIALDRVDMVLGEGARETASERFVGSDLVGAAYSAPFDYVGDFGPKGHTVLPAEFVTTDEGTGLVHTAVAFGEDDFRLGAEHGLELRNPVELDGSFGDEVGDYAGTFVKDADPAICEALEKRGLLLREEAYLHSYPHCWRCDTPLIYYAKSSWYLRTSESRDRMLAANAGIDWHPEHIREGRFGRWLEGNVDWALSRDRYWGTPIPIWTCTQPDCEEVFCAGSRADLVERGASVPDDLHRPYIDAVELECSAPSCPGPMKRVEAVLDTWFDSGSMPWAQFHYPFENEEEFKRRFPADFICEAIDQTRGWFYTLLAESVQLFDASSYRACVCLGLILDPEGHKMSKSRGNVVEPWEVIDAHGADAFRWYYLTAQQPWAGYRFSLDTVGESVRQFLLTVWNTYAFWTLYANVEGLDPSLPPDPPAREDTTELDRWALSRLQSTSEDVVGLMEAFDCTAAGREIAALCDDLSNWYVRLSRERFWEGDAAAFATLRHCMVEVTKLLAPFTPFLADEIYSNLVGGEAGDFGDLPDSVHLCDFPSPDPAWRDEALESAMAAARNAVELGRAARAQAKVKVRQPLRKAVIVASEAESASIDALADLVTKELNVKELEFVGDESALVSYRVKPNYRTLGPRFGKEMPLAAAAIEALDTAGVAEALERGARVGISVEGSEHELAADDLDLVMEPLEGYQVESGGGHAVALAMELDAELIAEGLAREVVRAVQNARKQSGLEVTDRISLSLGGDPELVDAAKAHADHIATETLAESLNWDPGEDAEIVEIDGRELRVDLARL